MTLHFPDREKMFMDHYGLDVDYYEFPHYKGFSVALRIRGAC